MRLVGYILAAALLMAASLQPSAAQKLVDPEKVAPEYREAAVKRRAEQVKLTGCSQKADAAKVVPRDRAAFVTDCLEK